VKPVFVLLLLCIYAIIYRYLHARQSLPGLITSAHVEPGFWGGVIHGFFLLASMVVRFRDPRLLVYHSNNSGFWYDLGYFGGIGAWLLLFLR
jgi:hypothetical protein